MLNRSRALIAIPIQCAILAILLSTSSIAAEFPAIFNTETRTNGPMPTAEVLAESKLPPGFHLSVFASEPDVRQPIAMATDPHGRLWVAENYTYSEAKVGYDDDLRDRILVFEDTDNDGHFDKRRVFWDGAQRLTSVEVGLGGVWALALPNLVFIPDTNEDGIADGPPQIVLDGFEYKVGRHTVANGLRWGPDGWLYGRHGIQSTSHIGPPGTPEDQRVAMNVGIWRYHPTRHVTEVVAQGTTNPWGMDWDAHGELFFINTVIGHLWHVIPGAHYRRMYGTDPTPHIYESIEQTADHVHWATGEVWTDVRKGVSDLTSAAGGGHAHTGLMIYQGGQWPDYWNGKLLTCNYHGRRLNVDELDRRGSGFVGRHQPDFVFFADPWFRGIDVIASPDGNAFVSDWSDTGECHDQDGIHRTSGRIYKLTYGDSNPAPPVDLTKLSEVELSNLQTSANDWLARQARRVLANRAHRGESMIEARTALENLTQNDPAEVHRLRALWALHVSGALETSLLRTKLTGTEYERAWAIRLLEDESHDAKSNAAEFGQFLATTAPQIAANDSSALVRLTLASLLQKLPLAQRPAIAAKLLAHAEDADDHNLPLMLWYGIEPLATNDTGFVDLIARARIPRVQRLGARRLAEEIDTAPTLADTLITAIAKESSFESRQAVLDGLAEGFAGRRHINEPISWKMAKSQLVTNANEDLRIRVLSLSTLFGDKEALTEFRQIALDQNAAIQNRRTALKTLIDARADDLRGVCEQLLAVNELSPIAVDGLAMFDDLAVADRLIATWPELPSDGKAPAINTLLSRSPWIMKMLDAIEAGKIARTELGVAQARQIHDLKDPVLNRRLTAVWGLIQDTDDATKRAALKSWQSKLMPDALKRSDLVEGQKLFNLTCGNCHTLYGIGGKIGPDLTGSGRHDLNYLLENILFPSTVVPAEFRQTTIELKDGRSLSGIVRSRSPQTLELQMIGQSTTISREDIQDETTSTLSMMPEGQLDALTETQAIDLIGYLMSTAPPQNHDNNK